MARKEGDGSVAANVYKFLITSNMKKSSFSALEERFSTEEDLKNLLSSDPRFWLGEIEQNSWEVRPKVQVELCYRYKTGDCNGECQKLHLCNENLLSPTFCGRPCKHGFSHNINDAHNTRIVDAAFPRYFKDDGGGKIKILRSSFPRLCKSFTEDGSCNKSFCGYLHICPEYIKERCSGDCRQTIKSNISKITAHNFTIDHNKKVLQSFNLSAAKLDRPHLLANILVGGLDQDNQNNTETYNNTRSKNLSSSSMVDICKPSGGARKKPDLNKSISNVSLNRTNNSTSETKKKADISLCYYYIHEKCSKSNCPRLHVCKEYLAGVCPIAQCKYGYTHNLLDDHNKPIVNKVQKCSSRRDALKFVRQSLPKLCENYNSGQCQWGNECNGIHICKEWLMKSVCGLENCKKSHDLWNNHNQRIARDYSSMSNMKGPIGQKNDYFKTDLIFSKFQLAEREIEEKKRPSIVSQQNGTSNTSNEPTEEFIFSFILNNSNDDACMSLDDILHNFENDQEKTETWIKHHSKSFRLTCDQDGGKKIHLCLENVLPCYDYWSNDGCNSTSCKMFHVCKKFLFRIQHSEISCKHDHFKEDVKENTLAIECNLESVSKEHLLMLLRTRFPFVCVENMTGNCLQDDLCPSIHICGDFIEGKCTKADGLCSHKHESGWTTKHTVEIMNLFHISVENYQKCIIYNENRSLSRSTNAAPKNELIADFNSLKDEGICYKFLNDVCIKGSSCSLRHPDPRSPYLWQYHERNFWKDFPHHINVELEKCFCEVAKTDFISQSKISQQLKIAFSEPGPIWMGIYNDACVDVRRLSTKSSVLLEDPEDGDVVVGLTEWKWYWEKDENVWEEYSGTIRSEDTEKSFLNKENLECKYFEIKKFKYVLRFSEMIQENLGPKYFTKRNIRRRPTFKDIKDISKSKDSHSNQLPSHWSKDFQDGDCVSIQDRKLKKDIMTNFLTSLGRVVDIVSVKEICNRIFYSKYMNTRQNFAERLGKDNINEMMLYHGTSSDVAPKICLQNFDWRLNGKNNTAFGKGSYFARDASYSDKYAKENGDGIECMFLAQVLVGKYTRGDRSMKRPPEDETKPGVLYDCCVNNVSNPSIFVIFERDQCYPKYLIKYKEKNLNNPKLGFVPQSKYELKVGMEVNLKYYGSGTIRWISPNESRNIGVELKMPNGTGDGFCCDGAYYFRCQQNHGVYVSLPWIITAWQ